MSMGVVTISAAREESIATLFMKEKETYMASIEGLTIQTTALIAQAVQELSH